MVKAGPVYAASSARGPLRQGEIISNLIQVKLRPDSIGSTDGYRGLEILHPLAIIVTQDCDLEQDFKARFGGKAGEHRLLPNILFCEVHTAQDMVFGERNRELLKSSTVRQNFANNKDERYHFLQKISSREDRLKEGLPELAIEFKRYFTIPTDEVYYRIKIQSARRRCRLKSPYLEHFSVRFHYYHYRIALPLDHATD